MLEWINLLALKSAMFEKHCLIQTELGSRLDGSIVMTIQRHNKIVVDVM